MKVRSRIRKGIYLKIMRKCNVSPGYLGLTRSLLELNRMW